MTFFKNLKFNLKTKIVLVNVAFITMVLTCFALNLSPQTFISHRVIMVFETILLICANIFNYILLLNRLKISNDEFLKYRLCRICKHCEIGIDSLLNQIFMTTPDVIAFMDTNQRYVMCSKRFYDLFKISAPEIIGKTQDVILPRQQVEITRKYLNEVISQKKPMYYTQKIYINNVEYIYDSISSPIVSQNNEVAGILTMSRNITETVSLRHSFERSNQKLYDLINNSPNLAYVLDEDGNYIFGNEKGKEFFITGVDYTSSGERIVIKMDKFRDEIINENRKIIATGERLVKEKEMIATNGESYWYEFTKTPLTNTSGDYYAVTTIVRCIDSEKRLQEQRETYIATLSHDLKTPAIAQVRALELLLSGQLGEFNESQKELLHLTLDSCNYLYDMVYTILSTCKFENGEISLNYSSVDFVKLTEECIKECLTLSKTNNTTIVFEPVGKSCMAMADKTEIKRAIVNFLSNGINYANTDTVVKVSVSMHDEQVELRIQNSSPYIDSDTMNRIFRKYVTHSEKFNKVGVGLGLYLSKKIVEAHNGEIIAESTKDNTNTFGFIIPVSVKSLPIKRLTEFSTTMK